MTGQDADLRMMTRQELIEEVLKLRQGIRQHRDLTGHDLCWWHPELWALLPEAEFFTPAVPPTEEFLARCQAFRASLDNPPAPTAQDASSTKFGGLPGQP